MQQKVLSALEFHKVKEQVIGHAASSLGKEMLLELKPSASIDEIKKQLDEVDEASDIIQAERPSAIWRPCRYQRSVKTGGNRQRSQSF
nr:hypothetical protein P5640_01610 [Bacillus subtilis]